MEAPDGHGHMYGERARERGVEVFQLKRSSNNSYIVIHTKTAIKNRKEREKEGNAELTWQ
jgi:hypothetical protein